MSPYTNNTMQAMFYQYDQMFESMINIYDQQHEHLKQIRGNQLVELKNIGNELVTLKQDSLCLTENTKVFGVKGNKFSLKLIEHDMHISKPRTSFGLWVVIMIVKHRVGKKVDAETFEPETKIEK